MTSYGEDTVVVFSYTVSFSSSTVSFISAFSNFRLSLPFPLSSFVTLESTILIKSSPFPPKISSILLEELAKITSFPFPPSIFATVEFETEISSSPFPLSIVPIFELTA